MAERLAAEIRSVLPGAVVAIPDPDGLDITYGGQTRPVGIGSVHTACAAGADKCDAAIKSYAQRTASYMLETAPLMREQLRAVVRSADYLDIVKARARPGEAFVSAPLAGGLVGVCYRVLPQGRRPVFASELSSLQLDEASARSLCASNLKAAMPPLATQWKELPDKGIGIIQFDGEVAGYLLPVEDWRPLAEKLGGLVVAAPGVDTVLYARGKSAVEVDALRTLAGRMFSEAATPLSAGVFRWTKDGWVEVK